MPASFDPAPPPRPLLVACLCAQWCRTCDAYREVLETLGAHFGAQVQAVWVDIEDHEAVLGNLEVDDFPTLLIARGDDVPCFFGPVLPHAATAMRLVQAALAGELPAVAPTPHLAGLPQKLRALPAA
jgi:thioredoxin 1